MRYPKYMCETDFQKVNMIFEVMRMGVDRVKICMGLGILLLMAGCSAGVSTEPESNLQEEKQLKEKLQIEEESQIVCSDDEFYVQCIQNLNQGNNITYADGYYYFRSQTENYSL